MDRRDFLKGVAALGAFRFAAGGWARGLDLPGMGPQGLDYTQVDERVLVILRLEGGNDGLNTVLPLDQYANLAKARSNILIPETSALRLSSTTGLHPAMTGLHEAYQNGMLRVVQAVGYPNHNQSHFRSTDIWFSGSDSDEVLDTGVLGRYLDGQFPGFPTGYPTTAKPHPPAIQIGATLFTLLQGVNAGLGMAINDPSRIYNLSSGGIDTAPATAAGHELEFLRRMASQTQLYGLAIQDAMAKATNRSDLYPKTGNRLADQFKSVARLIAGGLTTRVFVLSMGGFDTHSDQVSGSDPAAGNHADLLRKVSEAIAAFLDDLRLLGLDDRVVGMTVSEFGRRILSNGSRGTDHGTAAPLFVFGRPVRGGISGVSPRIPDATTSRDNVAMQYDYRSVYGSLLRDWMRLDEAELRRVLPGDHPPLDLIDSFYANQAVPIDFTFRRLGGGAGTRFEFDLEQDAPVSLKIFDLRGREVRTVVDGPMTAGTHQAVLDGRSLLPGRYLLRMQVGPSRLHEAFDILR